MNNDNELITETYSQVQENDILNQLLNENIEGLKELVEKFKAAKAANDQEQLKLLGRQIIDVLAEQFKPEAEEIVQTFEGDKLKTTRGNYGKYMQFLSTSNLKGMYLAAMVQALRQAGAGRGLEDALMVIRGPQ